MCASGYEHNLLFQQTQKLWYQGPCIVMSVHKRRYRQFYQVDVEAFGFSGYIIEAELIADVRTFWKMLGISEKVVLYT